MTAVRHCPACELVMCPGADGYPVAPPLEIAAGPGIHIERCGAFDVGSGRQCCKDNDHDGDHDLVGFSVEPTHWRIEPQNTSQGPFYTCDKEAAEWHEKEHGHRVTPLWERPMTAPNVNMEPPQVGEKRLCIVCSFEKPWGTYYCPTGESICVECRDAARAVPPRVPVNVVASWIQYRADLEATSNGPDVVARVDSLMQSLFAWCRQYNASIQGDGR